MAPRILRDNLVLVAAVVFPAVVALLFILATAIPRWTVPGPRHDLVLRAERPYTTPPPDVSVEFTLRDGRVEAIVTPVRKPVSEQPGVAAPAPQRWGLLLFDHDAMLVREITVDITRTLPEGEARTIVIDTPAGRVIPSTTAPDGYQYDASERYGGTGIVGDLFGMNGGYRRRMSVSRDGRRIELDLPAPYNETYGSIQALGWIADGSRP